MEDFLEEDLKMLLGIRSFPQTGIRSKIVPYKAYGKGEEYKGFRKGRFTKGYRIVRDMDMIHLKWETEKKE